MGPYEVLGELGRGGMGVVHRARHRALGHEVALKVIRTDEEMSRELTDRFRREAQAASALAGTPGIVSVRDTGVESGVLWLAMDLIEGATLEALARSGELSPAQSAELIAAVADAVAAAHAQGLIHRDLKPANILVKADGSPWVTDFGLVRRTKAGADVTRLTKTGEIVGTPSYMAPEQVMGGAIDARTDVYGLGATLFELLTGAPPFDGATMLTVLQDVLTASPNWQRLRAAGADGSLRVILEAAMAKEPADRYPTAAEFAADLRRWAAGDPVRARVRRRGSGAVLLVTALGVAGAGALAITLWGGASDPSAPTPAEDLHAVTAGRQAAELAAERFGVYLAVDNASAGHFARLQALWFGAPVSPDEQARSVAAIAAAVHAEGAAAAPHGDAWRAMAAYFAGDDAALGRMEAAAREAGPDPFPRLLHARTQLARYLRAVRLPTADQEGLPSAVDFQESDEARARRGELESALRAVGESAWWSLAPTDPYVQQLRDTAAALAAHDYATAFGAADLLAQHAAYAPLAADLSAFARFQLRDFAAAADAWAGLIDRLGPGAWPALHRRAAQARSWEALSLQGAERRRAATQAVGHADEALRADRADVTARLARIAAYRDLGRSLRGQAARASLAKALADADFLVELTGRSTTALYERALTRVSDGFAAMTQYQYDDAGRSFALAQADADVLVQAAAGSRRAHSVRSLAYEMQAALDDRVQRDSRPALRAVIHSLGVMLKTQDDVNAARRLLQHSSHLAWSEVRNGGDPAKALATAETLLESAPASDAMRKATDTVARTYLLWGKRRLDAGTEDPTFVLMRAAEIYARLPADPRAQLSRLTGLALLVRWSKKHARLDPAQTAYALRAAAEAAEVAPRSVDVHLIRAGLFESLDRIEDAVAAYERALTLDPANRLATQGLASLRGK